MILPDYARNIVPGFLQNGAPRRQELDKKEAQTSLDEMKDEFQRWRDLDETEQDLAKGVKGEVRVGGQLAGGETTAVFSGNTNHGDLTVFKNEPNAYYGSTTVSATRLRPQTADRLVILNNNNVAVTTSHLHVEHQISSDGPVVVKGPTEVTLKDLASSGYILYT